MTQLCDDRVDCVSGLDEADCPRDYLKRTSPAVPDPPVIVNYDGRGNMEILPLNLSSGDDRNLSCPETHFVCPGDLYCLPVYVRCNDVYDCPGHEDEADCDTYTCPGFYRCRASRVCVHRDHVCDGNYHCPQRDDELFCQLDCPDNCTCHGLAFTCSSPFSAHNHPDLRFLDASSTGMTPAHFVHNKLLIHLSLARCSLAHLSNLSLPNLRSLDLTDNLLTVVKGEHLHHVQNLRVLSLAGNPLISFLNTASVPRVKIPDIMTLDLSRVRLREFNLSMLSQLVSLQTLNLSGGGIEHVVGEGQQLPRKLHVLDVRGCPFLTFQRNMLSGTVSLQAVFSDNYKLCCPASLPADFNLNNCQAPSDEISSCGHLLGSSLHRIVLPVFAALALLGNAGSLMLNILLKPSRPVFSTDVFLCNLYASNLLMGVYLAMIGVADRLYQGTYPWEDVQWRNSVACKVAGFLSLLSSEASAFIICLVTLDSFLVIRLSCINTRFTVFSAKLACAFIWLGSVVVAGAHVFLLEFQKFPQTQTGLCIPLPVTRTGLDLAVIVVNFALFLLVGAGYLSVYISLMTSNTMVTERTSVAHDMVTARRVSLVVLSHFVCWFPVGLLSLVASQRAVSVPDWVNATVAVLVLPANSALTPLLYALTGVMERMRRQREERLLARLSAHRRAQK
nr:hypothetical protein BaRGS_023787 [Batillaria attramentaria]